MVITPTQQAGRHVHEPTPVRLPRWGGVTLTLFALGIIVLDLVGFFTSPSGSWQGLLFEVAMLLTLPLFVVAPVVAATSLAILVFGQAVGLASGSYLLFAAAMVGVVIYTCPRWCCWGYSVVAFVAVIITATATGSLTLLGPFGLVFIAVISALIGIGARRAHLRSAVLVQRAVQMEAERAQAVAVERERITAELHDILAHDVTLIAMHARVLEAIDDPQTRRESLAVIKRSATRSLADIRRLVSTMQADQPADESELAIDVRAALETAQAELESVGAQVSSQVTGVRDLAPAVAATLVRMVREATTNIIRHAGAAPQVTICVERSDASLVAEITNSIGVVDKTLDESTHLGIERLSARVEALSGHLYSIRKGQRWTLRVVIPLF